MLFFLFSFAILFFCFFVISSRNPVHSVLSLVCVFLLSSVLLICLEVEFLALSFVIVYVGAIAIFFLFVVMMLDIKVVDGSFDSIKQNFFAYLVCFFFFSLMVLPFLPSASFANEPNTLSFFPVDWFSEIASFSNLVSLGLILYTYYFVFFLIAGFILLIAVFGALMLLLTLNTHSSQRTCEVLLKNQTVKKRIANHLFILVL